MWHKTCRTAVDTQKVERARKKYEGEVISPVKTRHMNSDARLITQASPSPSTFSSEPVNTPCPFCDEVANKKELRKAATLGLDKKVNDCARVLGDKHLFPPVTFCRIATLLSHKTQVM